MRFHPVNVILLSLMLLMLICPACPVHDPSEPIPTAPPGALSSATPQPSLTPNPDLHYNLTFTKEGFGSTTPFGIVEVTHGLPLAISASATLEGHRFYAWSVTAGNAIIAEPEAANTTITVIDGDATVNALFGLKTYQLTVYDDNQGFGTTSPFGSVEVTHGEATTIEGLAINGFHFTGWSLVSGTAEITDSSWYTTTVVLSTGDAYIQGNFAVNDFLYRREITLSPATSLADYQVRLELNTSNFDYSRVRPDGADLRFFDQGRNSLAYWTESWSNTGTSVIWIKIPQTGTASFYMHYGSSTVTASASDKDAVLDFYDEFNGSSAHFSRLPYPFGSDPDPGNRPNSATFYNNGSEEYIRLGYTDDAELRASPNLPASSYLITLKWRAQDFNNDYQNGNVSHFDEAYGATTWHPNRLVVINGSLIYEKTRALLSFSETKNMTYTGALNSLYLSFLSAGGMDQWYYTYYDYIRIRKYAAVAPVAAPGTEQESDL